MGEAGTHVQSNQPSVPYQAGGVAEFPVGRLEEGGTLSCSGEGRTPGDGESSRLGVSGTPAPSLLGCDRKEETSEGSEVDRSVKRAVAAVAAVGS